MQSWVEINEQALLHNFKQIKKLAGKNKIALCIKGDAYGHGMLNIAKKLDCLDVEFFAVTKSTEALNLIENNVQTKILVMSEVDKPFLKQNISPQIHLTVYSLEYLEKLAGLKIPLQIHLALETGMNRQGISLSELSEATKLLKTNPQIIFLGLSTHFAADFTTQQQEQVFKNALLELKKQNLEPIFAHLSNSSAVLHGQIMTGNLVRVGLLLYGYSPISTQHKFIPVKRVYSKIIQIKTVQPGEGISYEHNFIAKKPMRIGIIPFGYYDGYPRNTKAGTVYLERQQCFVPVLGNICMNHLIVDLTGLDSNTGDVVEVLGLNQTAEMLASKADTISYEIITRFRNE